ncbi:WD40 repeat-like protein [Lactarius sanguifluus]|nr:WD40 repeat-like protein [Lactarius sanguifluus]
MTKIVSCSIYNPIRNTPSWVKRGASARTTTSKPISSALKTLLDACTELERANAVAHTMSQRDEDSKVDDMKVDDDDDNSAWVDEDDEPMDDDAMKGVVAPKRNGDLSEYNLDMYDKEDDGLIKGLQFHRDNDNDPYITLKEDDDELEREENEVLPTDNMLVTTNVEQNVPRLHFFVYDEPTDSMPLCLEWLDYPVSSATKEECMDTEDGPGSQIEIYSIDLLDTVYPDALLGNPKETAAHVPEPGTGKKKRKTAKHGSASETHPSTPSSPSRGTAPRDRSDKVQAVQWNPTDPAVLLSRSHDRTVRVFDSRAPYASVGAVVGADVEAIRWDPWDNHGFYVSLENGMVVNFDVRTLPSDLEQPMALDVNAHIRGCLATAGTDKMVKIWNVQEHEDGVRKVFGPRLAEAGRKLRERTTGGVIGVADDEETVMMKSNSCLCWRNIA